jgi:hypothetical protein
MASEKGAAVDAPETSGDCRPHDATKGTQHAPFFTRASPFFPRAQRELMRRRCVKHAMQQDLDLPFWNAGLDKPVLTEDGSELRTLHEAAAFIGGQASRRRSLPFDAARLSLEQAAETGHGADILKARRMIELALDDIRLHQPTRTDHSPQLPHPIRLESRELVTVADAMDYLTMLGADTWQHDDCQEVQEALVTALDTRTDGDVARAAALVLKLLHTRRLI